MAPEGVQPLRITKSTPIKMSGPLANRALSEISPLGLRRNSPSFNHIATKGSLNAGDSSPLDSSPPNSSPHVFWKSRENAPSQSIINENTRPGTVSPTRRASIENLKRASRVTNSSMFAREQDSEVDPDSSILSNSSSRPLALNAWGGAIDHRATPSFRSHTRGESISSFHTISQPTSPTKVPSPTKSLHSPQKSSLSTTTRFGMNHDDSILSEDRLSRPSTRGNTPHKLRKHKSVTFDEQPPQINEYEMVTPDPSSVASGSREGSCESDTYDMDESFDTGSFEREDSFDDSLEDADKTPVVLPEDWRFMNPEAANTDLADTFEDPFDKPQSSSLRYRGTPEREIGVARSNSIASNGDRRPLPPLPGAFSQDRKTSSTSTEALPKPSLLMPSPPRPASMSKAEILSMRSSPMPFEERLQLLSAQNEEAAKIKRGTSIIGSVEESHSENGTAEVAAMVQYQPPPRVSRESILRKVKSQRFEFDDDEVDESGLATPRNLMDDEIDYSNLDPDVPIPSRETSSTYEDDEAGNRIRREGEIERTIDMYCRNAEDEENRSISPFEDDFARESSVIHHKLPCEEISDLEDDAFVPAREEQSMADEITKIESDHGPAIPSIVVPAVLTPMQEPSNRMSLPEFTSFFDKNDLSFGLESYLTPSPPQEDASKHTQRASHLGIFTGKPDLRPTTPTEQLQPSPAFLQGSYEQDFGTPDSVIHCPDEDDNVASPPIDFLEVPEPVATIKASGSKLKTRVSATPADLQQMAATRRHVSGEQPLPIDELGSEASFGSKESLSLGDQPTTSTVAPVVQTTMNRRQSLRQLDVPIGGVSDDLGLGLTQEFDRLLEAKKKGYLMRQNTKLIVANSRQASGESKTSETSQEKPDTSSTSASHPGSSRDTRSAGNSPRKQVTQTWTTEPWNGRMRRQSTRRTTIVPEKRMVAGAVRPLPGMESNVTSALDSVAEDQIADDLDESGERGRLFVKVVGVKDLDLPLPKNERCYFQMTLDNGLHCVTTAWSELGRTAPIGQEFELVVFDDLEFQLTLQTRLERPKSSASSAHSLAPSIGTKKTSAFSRLFTSPKKRREQELKSQEEEMRAAIQRQQELDAQAAATRQPTAWDLQNELVGPDGSFARAYIALSNHEKQAYGRPFTVEIPAWNEWAIEDKNGASTRSKMGGIQRKPPYCIAKMQLQMMYIPRPRDVNDEELPKSMSAAIRQLKDAEATATRTFEGHLSQQGGDCPYWRRRFFKLNGSKLTAYHDMTRQPRATISLSKAAKLIDDKSSLTKVDPASPVKSKSRRKSAFAEDEEGYMFVEEGFRIRFANGEVIDFYADDRDQKEAWMKVLADVVGRESPAEKKTWMSMVIAKERAAGTAPPANKLHEVPEEKLTARNGSKTASSSAPTSPRKQLPVPASTSGGMKENRPPPPEKSPRHDLEQVSPSKSKATNSPRKLAAPQSPIKRDSAFGVRDSAINKRDSSPGKRNSMATNSSATSPRKQNKENSARRAAVRSMIF